MTGRALLYGASGYTGREIALSLAGEVDLVLAGRDSAKIRAVAEPLDLPWRAFALSDASAVAACLADIDVVLHAAGPFEDTAQPMIEGCLRTATHYLDLGGEWPVFVAIMAQDAVARAAEVMLLPGVGLTIAATDCLLARAVETWPDTVRLCLGISRAQAISRGSVTSAARLLDSHTLIRRDGLLTAVPAGSLTRAFDFGGGLSEATATSWADIATGEFTTGVRNIEVYSQTRWPERAATRIGGLTMGMTGSGPWRAAGGIFAQARPAEPSARVRERARFAMVVEAFDPWRRVRRLRMDTRDGYGASVLTAAEALRRVVAGAALPGFQTPAHAFGSNFASETGAAMFEADNARTAA